MDKAIGLMKLGYEMRGEHLEVGLSCPYCKRLLDYSRVYTRISEKEMAS